MMVYNAIGEFQRILMNPDKQLYMEILIPGGLPFEVRVVRPGMDCGIDLTHDVQLLLGEEETPDIDRIFKAGHKAYFNKYGQRPELIEPELY